VSLNLVPDKIINSIYELDGAELYRKGVRLLLADLDNTIARYAQPEPDEALRLWVRGMEEQGVTVFVLSNGRRPARSRRFCEGFVPYISHASKPWPKNFHRAMQRCGASPWETVIIGDQIFTDVWGGHNAGIRACIYVRAIALDSLPRLLRYGIEAPFRMACLLRGERF
jgi:HAD superfamily phosphatase (TIGR01668 family)